MIFEWNWKLSAVMGPSGAGKTSLLNVLAGYIHRGINGQVMLNDKEMVRNFIHFKN